MRPTLPRRTAILAAALLAAFALLSLRPRATQAQAPNMDRALINHILDSLHDAASRADGRAYFEQFADDAIFMGTDATERWTIPMFKEYAQARFDQGKGWTYKPTYRSVYVSKDRTIAWFDELLNNEKYGVCRGSGVLVNNGAAWLIEQYNLSVPIPNDLMPKVTEMIRADSEAKMKAIEGEGAKKAAQPDGMGKPGATPK